MLKSAPKKRGFTLIELLIVIAIIGVLAAVVLIAVNPARRLAQARDTGRKNDVAQIATALEAYYTSSTSGYPLGNGCTGTNGLTTLTASQDLKKLPQGPTNEYYCYSVVGSGATAEASVYVSLEAPTGTNGWWCWRSTAGKAQEVAAGTDCIPQ